MVQRELSLYRFDARVELRVAPCGLERMRDHGNGIPAWFDSIGAGVGAAIDEEILPGDERRLRESICCSGVCPAARRMLAFEAGFERAGWFEPFADFVLHGCAVAGGGIVVLGQAASDSVLPQILNKK